MATLIQDLGRMAATLRSLDLGKVDYNASDGRVWIEGNSWDIFVWSELNQDGLFWNVWVVRYDRTGGASSETLAGMVRESLVPAVVREVASDL